MENETLATELLHELKESAKRWFIAFCIMIALEAATIAGFMWYISLPVEDVTVKNEDGNANYIGNNMSGVINNGQNPSNQKSNEK